jgi:hypothetical protein
MIALQSKLQDAASDQIIKAALPTITKLLEPLLAEMMANVRHLLLGDMPPTLVARLIEGFNTDIPIADARVIWEAVGLAVADAAPEAKE